MALSYTDKVAIAQLKAEGLTPYAIAKKLNISSTSLYRALENDTELLGLVESFGELSGESKKNAAANARQALKELYEKKGVELVEKFYKLINVPEELIEASSLRDRVGAAKLVLEMVGNIANAADEAQIDDECAATIEIISEDASGGE